MSRLPCSLLLLAWLWLPAALPAASELPELEIEPAQRLAAAADLVLERQRWRLGNSAGWAWRAQVPRGSPVQVRAAPRATAFAELLPEDSGPWVAVNGGFYDADRGPMGLVIANGEILSSLRRAGGSGFFELRDGWPRILHHSAYQPGATQALQSIDRIVAEGRSLVARRADARIAARAAVALSAESLWLVLIAGDELLPALGASTTLHSAASRGLPLWALAEYLVSALGAGDALNLDGSVSAQMAARIGDYELRIQGLGSTVNALVVRP